MGIKPTKTNGWSVHFSAVEVEAPILYFHHKIMFHEFKFNQKTSEIFCENTFVALLQLLQFKYDFAGGITP